MQYIFEPILQQNENSYLSQAQGASPYHRELSKVLPVKCRRKQLVKIFSCPGECQPMLSLDVNRWRLFLYTKVYIGAEGTFNCSA